MGRPVMLSNGQLMVGLDENGLVHDFYYPYVGMENLATPRNSPHKIGVWVDGLFSWTDDGDWKITVDFRSDALISEITAVSHKLNVTLHFNDFVDVEHNALVRRVTIQNDSDRERDIRLFMHQVFEISRDGRADTALFVPDARYIYNYKGRVCLLIGGKIADGPEFDQFSVGNYGIEGKEGTFKDAEDGELSNNTVEHGGVDSVIRFQQYVQPRQQFRVDYWIVAADNQTDGQIIHNLFRHHPVDERMSAAVQYYQNWIGKSSDRLAKLPERYRIAVQKSLLVIKSHCDVHGSVLASGDSSIFNYGRDYYCYCWPRDAAYVLWPLIRLGYYDEAKAFFAFARDVLHPDGYLMHKYQPDRSVGSTWHPLLQGNRQELAIQEDETAGVVFMMGEYFNATNDRQFLESYYHSFIEPCADFMADFIDPETGLPHASYDLWEEKFLTTSYTVAIVVAGLETAAELAKVMGESRKAEEWLMVVEQIRSSLHHLYNPNGYYRKGYLIDENGQLNHDDTVDISSLYGICMYGVLPPDDQTLINTARTVENRLLNSSPIGGVIRYEHDKYFLRKHQHKGNPWIVGTMWLAQCYSIYKLENKVKTLIDWAIDRMLPSGVLSEQYDPENGDPIGVTPLVWSHAELVNTILDYENITRR